MVLPTEGTNKVHEGKKQADQIFIHGMNSWAKDKTETGSAGCWGTPYNNKTGLEKQNHKNFNKPFSNSPGNTGISILLRMDNDQAERENNVIINR